MWIIAGMALPQRDDLIGEVKRTDALLEYAVPSARAAREPYRIVDALGRSSDWRAREVTSTTGSGDVCECKPVWNGRN